MHINIVPRQTDIYMSVCTYICMCVNKIHCEQFSFGVCCMPFDELLRGIVAAIVVIATSIAASDCW